MVRGGILSVDQGQHEAASALGLPPTGLDAFADRVVPLLQEQGVFRTHYEGTTLRDHLGLDTPGLSGP